MSNRRRNTVLAVIAVVFVVSAYFVMSRLRRESGIETVQNMGGTVTIKRVYSATSPIPIRTTVCWVAFEETRFGDRELAELILAVQRIGVSDTRIDLGGTTLNESQRKRLMREVSERSHLNWSPVRVSPLEADGPLSKAATAAESVGLPDRNGVRDLQAEETRAAIRQRLLNEGDDNRNGVLEAAEMERLQQRRRNR